MRKGKAMMKELKWEDDGQEIIAEYKVSKVNAAKLAQLVENDEFITSSGNIESPYAIHEVNGQVATFVIVYEPRDQGYHFYAAEDMACGMIRWDMRTIEART